MDKNKIPVKLKCRHKKADYEKVYEYPLDWCPLFGFLPEIENTYFENDNVAYKIADRCIRTIESARLNLGVDDNNMVKYARLPDVKELIFIYHEYGDKCSSMRFLFQNLDYLALKTAHSYSPWIAERLYCCGELKVIPNKPIGRTSNRGNNCYSDIAYSVHVNQIVEIYLLEEAQKIVGKTINLEIEVLFYLYAILEAWLILTSLFFRIGQIGMVDNLSGIYERLIYVEDLLRSAEYKSQAKEIEIYSVEKFCQSKGGKKKKTPGIQAAIEKVIELKGIEATASTLWTYFKIKHKGQKNAMVVSLTNELSTPLGLIYGKENIEYLIFWEEVDTGDEMVEKLVQLDIKSNARRDNVYNSFQDNVTDIKKKIKKVSE